MFYFLKLIVLFKFEISNFLIFRYLSVNFCKYNLNFKYSNFLILNSY